MGQNLPLDTHNLLCVHTDLGSKGLYLKAVQHLQSVKVIFTDPLRMRPQDSRKS